jgi:seryl-tRNA synthetase
VSEPLDIDALLRELRYEDNSITVAAADEIERLRESNADLAVIIERLGKPVVNVYRWEDVKRFTDAEAERDRLAALVAEYRAESNETWTTIRARAEAAEAKLAEIEAEMNAYANAYAEANKRLAAAEAEIEFMRAWCADHFGGLMPPTREQNAALMRALDEEETDRD